jgi:hypothetical protein
MEHTPLFSITTLLVMKKDGIGLKKYSILL